MELSKELARLLNPYISKEDRIAIWKDYLKSIERPETMTEIERLAQEIHKDHDIPIEALKSLFDTVYRPPPETSLEKVWRSKHTPPKFDPLDCLSTERSINPFAISDLKKRMSFQGEVDWTTHGPNNADLDVSTHEWCHERSAIVDSSNSAVNHAMLKCECDRYVFDKFFECDGCGSTILPEQEEWVRIPLTEGLEGGWSNFYCNQDCLRTFNKLDVMQDLILNFV